MLKRLFPILGWLPQYNKSYLSGDISAGITVGIMLIPQGMAYAMIAGLPPVFGLYAALVPQVIYAIMGTSRQLAVGPVAMDSLLVASGLGALSLSGIEEYINMAIFLAMFIGVIQIALGFLKMGFLVNFLSKPVISGFTSAAAIIIALSQLKHLLGIDIPRSSHLQNVLQDAWFALDTINFFTLAIGLLSIAIIISLNQINKKIPAALVVVIMGTLAVYFLGWAGEGVKIVGTIPKGLPAFHTPEFDSENISQILPIALTLALIGFVEAISIGKTIEERHKYYEVRANQELRALGAANFFGALFQSFPVTSGFSRTAVNDNAGAKTGIAALISALIIGLTLLFLTPLFYYLPNAVLAAIIMVAVYGLIDVQYAKVLYRNSRDEFVLLLLTFILTLTWGIVEGILLGVLGSLMLMLYRTSKPHIAILGRINGTDYFKNVNRFGKDIEQREDVLVFRFDGQLFFGNQDYFKKKANRFIKMKGDALKAVVISAESINYIDNSAVHMLDSQIDEWQKMGLKIFITGAIGPTRDILFKSGIVKKLGMENLFVRTYEAVDHYDGINSKTHMQEMITQQRVKSKYSKD